ncbi:hypothetical protein BWI97_25645 [Siphonobacter sp. BAB-5405]|uniref:hypothetical protein n=1 Tax=Siphonobacter sp. BAB-5405 TaxID=1864825 RepID=UPI000C80951A|nr:hypothetical protein [Siphonobacter sp. BAB-5405]PMD87626.1 hypothetical protein BWI97_25645 [Siphonobacter sp. BAB-5405]
MKVKFLLPALLILPLGLFSFKPSDNSTSNKFENLEKLDYGTLQGQQALLTGAGFIARSSTVTRNAETSTVSQEAVVASFAQPTSSQVSLGSIR